MNDIISRIDAHLAECEAANCQGLEPDAEPILLDCRDEIIAARACAEMMLQGTGQPLAERMAERVLSDITNTFAGVPQWIPVMERLPEAGETVLLWNYVDHRLGWLKYTANGAAYFFSTQDECNIHPTHWMPLPAPPTDGK